MMNILAISLILTSLVASGVWLPIPEKLTHKSGDGGGERVLVKEGHRVVVVEYENRGDTKVLIAPQDGPSSEKSDEESPLSDGDDDGQEKTVAGTVEHAKEKLREAASAMPNLGQGVAPNGHAPSPRELVCDALGKCKHKISGLIGKGRYKASEKARQVFNGMHEIEEDAKDDAAEAFTDAKEKAQTVGKEAKETVETAKRGAEAISKDIGRNMLEERETAQKEARETVEKVKRATESLGEDIGRNVLEKEEMVRQEAVKKLEEAREGLEETVDRAKARAHKLTAEGEKKLMEILRRGNKTASGAVLSVLLPGTVQLLGFCSAFGMGVWVTFLSSYVLAEALRRQQFSVVQSRIYPVYFKAMGCGVGVALLGHLIAQRGRVWGNKAEMFQCYNLGISLLMLLANLLYLEPRAAKVMFETMKLEKEEGRGGSITAETSRVVEPHRAAEETTSAVAVPDELVRSRIIRLNERLKKLNTVSSFLNVLTLMALSGHLVYLGQRLHLSR